jgi:serine protease Do/putative serine protease PepD
VIGMASARESRGDPGAGLAFAIPSNVVKAVVDRVKSAPAAPVGAPAPAPAGALPATVPAEPVR